MARVGMGALGLLLAGAPACSPQASTIPLGLGPLAIAEREARAERENDRREKRPRPARRSGAAPSKESIAKAQAPQAEVEIEVEEVEPGDDGSGEGAASAPPARFAGMYAGEDIAIYRLTGFPDQEQRDDQAKIRIEDGKPGSVNIVLINSADGSDLCELAARVEGKAALLETAQPCFTGGAEGAPQAELTSGRAVLDGDQLRMEAEGTLFIPDQDLEGDLTYSFEGERQ